MKIEIKSMTLLVAQIRQVRQLSMMPIFGQSSALSARRMPPYNLLILIMMLFIILKPRSLQYLTIMMSERLRYSVSLLRIGRIRVQQMRSCKVLHKSDLLMTFLFHRKILTPSSKNFVRSKDGSFCLISISLCLIRLMTEEKCLCRWLVKSMKKN